MKANDPPELSDAGTAAGADDPVLPVVAASEAVADDGAADEVDPGAVVVDDPGVVDVVEVVDAAPDPIPRTRPRRRRPP